MGRRRRIPLSNHTSAHDNSRVLGANTLVRRLRHIGGILESSDTGDGIGVARVDNDAAQAGIGLGLEQLAAEADGGGLELILGEDGGGGARAVGRDEGQVGLAGVAGLDADKDARGLEAARVGARGRHVLGLGRRYGTAHAGVCARESHGW